MTRGVALIYCRLVTLVLNWSNVLQASSAERFHLSSAKRPLRNWDLGSSLHDLKPSTLFTVTGCQTRTQTNGWYTNLYSSGWGLPPALLVIVAEIDIVCCSTPLFVAVFYPVLVIMACFSLGGELNIEQPLHHVTEEKKQNSPLRFRCFPLMGAQMKNSLSPS